MFALLIKFTDLCLLRAAPQDLPHSRFLMQACIGGYFLVGFVVSILEQEFGQALLSTCVDTGLLVGLANLGLLIRENGPRAVQTITALTGTGILFGLISWPLVAFAQQLDETEVSSLSLVLLVLIIWNVGVIGNILRHALDVPMWVGAGIALLYVYTSLYIMNMLYFTGSAS